MENNYLVRHYHLLSKQEGVNKKDKYLKELNELFQILIFMLE